MEQVKSTKTGMFTEISPDNSKQAVKNPLDICILYFLLIFWFCVAHIVLI